MNSTAHAKQTASEVVPETVSTHFSAEDAAKRNAVERRAPHTWEQRVNEIGGLRGLVLRVGLGPPEMYAKSTKWADQPVPVVNNISEHIFVWKFIIPPMLMQWISYKVFPDLHWHPVAAFVPYAFFFILLAALTIKRFHNYMLEYGTFDQENRGRDHISDKRHMRLATGAVIFLIFRVVGLFAYSYDRTVAPTLSVWLPLKIFAFEVILDYAFYCYHRSCHQVKWLWNIHSGHHAAKHPTPVQAIQADSFQEVIELFIVPTIAYLSTGFDFFDLWPISCVLIFTEIYGHSGVRVYFPTLASSFLWWWGGELCVEDHDLHHRYGRSGQSYGKQTRVWDSIFGTCAEREDTEEYAIIGPKRVKKQKVA
ncbi:uncharacterized protein L969DRAFT_86309 [Mixia osmundae IAM 14324]|uniref:Fatty acid hydroxylase domain-containing protein n=1 Tax=Mixia osmundae (strain CBS 9802 / IAM 14324 / JCM 22182 / KY 12970) TaxID=764103 RepID=G7DUC5_MIXOS|nr:uncharacterized protein L969DRAFT_86309 [Mixia osmundae IAM 14324]KEI41057.1 hypothetical protein L969DRAFT_86309 [Mixia osmundae IAM 14324]GAA94185.1 hypothetical protein E5Q_00833 [Mixia osmundae IAM 14324]